METGLESRRAIELLIDQAWSAAGESRFASVVSVAGRAVRAAEQYGDPGLHIRALQVEADALRMSGDSAAALAGYTRILGMVEEPATAAGLDSTATQGVARTYLQWVASALMVGGIAVRELFGVLDAADRWLTAIGRRDWRAGVLLERAEVHRWLGELDRAVALAQEALTAYRPNTPGYNLAAHRFRLGDMLHHAGRAGEAQPLYQAILDDPKTSAYDHKVAWEGLARCALARGDAQQALRHATTAVDTAEPLGDNPLTTALDVLVAAQRAVGDLDAAWHTATRHLRAARRIGTPTGCTTPCATRSTSPSTEATTPPPTPCSTSSTVTPPPWTPTPRPPQRPRTPPGGGNALPTARLKPSHDLDAWFVRLPPRAAITPHHRTGYRQEIMRSSRSCQTF